MPEIRSQFFNGKVYNATDFVESNLNTMRDGILANKEYFKLVPTGGRNVTLTAGRGWVQGHAFQLESSLELTVDQADGALNRVDTIIVRLDTTAQLEKIEVELIKGGIGSGMTPPVREGAIYELAVWQINMTAGLTEITESDVMDLRPNSTYCGWAGALSSDEFIFDDKADRSDIDLIQNQIDSGDITANAVKIQGTPVSETAPLADQVLAFTGTEIEFVALSAVLQNAVAVGQTTITTTNGAKNFVQTVGTMYSGRKFIAMAMWQSYSSIVNPFAASLLGAGTVTAQGKITLTNLYGVTPGTFNLVYAIF